jgi:hypothetical protein
MLRTAASVPNANLCFVVTQILLAIATAFLAAALGVIATNASTALLISFLATSVVSGSLAVAWQDRRVRSRLPFARPFPMELHALWEDGTKLRRRIKRENDSAQGTLAEMLDAANWEGRVWTTLSQKMPERASVYEANHGGRLRPDQEISRADLTQRMQKHPQSASVAHSGNDLSLGRPGQAGRYAGSRDPEPRPRQAS